MYVLAKCDDRTCCAAPIMPLEELQNAKAWGFPFPVESLKNPGHYVNFDTAWDDGETRVESSLPVLDPGKVKHPFGLVQNRARACLVCQECGSPRVIYSPKDSKKCKPLEGYIDTLKTAALYSCGALLPEDNVGGCYINGNLVCGDAIEQNYYRKKLGPLICSICASNLEKAEVEKYNKLLLKYSVVKPSCSDVCGPFQTSYERKVPLKRKRKADSKGPPQKRTRVSPWVSTQERTQRMKDAR